MSAPPPMPEDSVDATPRPGRAFATRTLAALRRIATPEGIERLEQVDVGDGDRQWISIRGRNRHNPVLLMIHGGPGTAEMPLGWAFQTPWEDFVTVVHWDQRGVGKNAAAADREALLPTLSLERILADGEAVIDHLRATLGKSRVALLGLSWGAMLGVRLAERLPSKVSVYAGVGQAISTAYEPMIKAETLAAAERATGSVRGSIATAAAKGYFKLLAHKDEFEVARLLGDPAFRSGLEQQFEGPVRLHAHLGGGPLARQDASGRPLKTELSGWVWPALRVLARLRVLRGSWLDPWRHNAERQLARECLAQYEQDLDRIEAELAQPVDERRHALLQRLAALPERLRGYGHVRARHAAQVRDERQRILIELDAAAFSTKG